MDQQNKWLAITLSQGGYEVVAFECPRCHKFTYKGKYINAPLCECPNCKAKLSD